MEMVVSYILDQPSQFLFVLMSNVSHSILLISGTFIGEFVGEVVNPDMMEHRPVDYAYDLPLHNKFYKGTNICVFLLLL
jgi:hypothetical protein